MSVILSACLAGDNEAMAEDVVSEEELRTLIAARKEVDDELDDALIEGFVGRIEQRLAHRRGEEQFALERRREHQKEMVLGSMAISIPLLAIAAIFTGLPGVIAVCVALVAIAVVTAR
jgi:hypothetical protein